MPDETRPLPKSTPRTVRISTGCRLHFGLLSVGRATGRQFGGAGVMLESPGWEILFSHSKWDEILAAVELQPRILETLRRLRDASGCRQSDSGLRIEITRQIPRHAGLGSGTQLGLALAQGWNLLHENSPRSAIELARQSGRGLRSAIGVHGFDHGGFLVEAGKLGDEISPLVEREEFPADWRFVLIQPAATAGLNDQAELQGFARLEPMPESTTKRLWDILENRLLPAVRGRDFDGCGGALFDFGRLVGQYFAPVQGGVYASPQMVQLAEWLQHEGYRGIGQTSWGPTLFVLCATENAAQSLCNRLEPLADCRNCRITIAVPRNRGADVSD